MHWHLHALWALALAFWASAVRHALEDPLATDPEELACAADCVNFDIGNSSSERRQLRRGHVILRPAIPQPRGLEYLVRALPCSDGRRALGNATVVPHLDPSDPVHKSVYHIFLDVDVEDGPAVGVCGGSECLCRLRAPERHWRVLRALSLAAAWLPAGQGAKLTRHLQHLEDHCPSEAVTDLAAVSLLLLVVCFFVCVFIALIAMFRHAFQHRNSHEAASAAGSAPAIIVPTPLEDLQRAGLQALTFATCVTSLQGAIFDSIKKEAPEPVVWFIVLWSATFGCICAMGLYRTMCQMQLVHAALAQGLCVSAPRGHFLHFFALAGLCVLVLCVGGSLLRLGVVALLSTVVGTLYGPLSAMFQKVLAARTDAKAMEDQEGTHRMPELLRLLQKELDEPKAQKSPLEQRLSTGDVASVGLGEVVALGRGGRSLQEAVHELRDTSTGRASCSFSLVQDAGWLASWIYQGSDSRAGFATMPLLLLTFLILIVSSASQASRYACSVPSLEMLKLTLASESLKYDASVSHFSMAIDSSFTEAFLLTAGCESSKKLTVTMPGGASEEENVTGAVINVPLANMPLPLQVRLDMEGLRNTTSSYSVAFVPRKTMPGSVLISAVGGTASSYERCLAWSMLSGSMLSVPEDVTALDVEVSLVEIELGVPHACGHLSNETTTVFCTHAEIQERLQMANGTCRGSACQSRCELECRHDNHCLTAFHAETGCYKARRRLSREQCQLHHGRQQNTSGLLRHPVTGRLCRADGSGYQCSAATSSLLPTLQFKEVALEWLASRADFSLQLELAVGNQKLQSDSGVLSLWKGLPLLTEVLVDLRHMHHHTYYEGNVTRGDWRIHALPVSASLREDTVVVTLGRYTPHDVQGDLMLYMAPLLPDPSFELIWMPGQLFEAAPWLDFKTNEYAYDFVRCNQSGFLRGRFRLCGAKDGWTTKVMRAPLLAWTPKAHSFAFMVHAPRSSDIAASTAEAMGEKIYRVVIQLEAPTEDVVEWALEPPGGPQQCTLHAGAALLNTILLNPMVLCQLLRRGCKHVHLERAAKPVELLHLIKDGLFAMLWKAGGTSESPEKFARKAAELLHCSTDARMTDFDWLRVDRLRPCKRSGQQMLQPLCLQAPTSVNGGNVRYYTVGALSLLETASESNPMSATFVCQELMEGYGQPTAKAALDRIRAAIASGSTAVVLAALKGCFRYAALPLASRKDICNMLWKVVLEMPSRGEQHLALPANEVTTGREFLGKRRSEDFLHGILRSSHILASDMVESIIEEACSECIRHLTNFTTQKLVLKRLVLPLSSSSVHLVPQIVSVLPDVRELDLGFSASCRDNLCRSTAQMLLGTVFGSIRRQRMASRLEAVTVHGVIESLDAWMVFLHMIEGLGGLRELHLDTCDFFNLGMALPGGGATLLEEGNASNSSATGNYNNYSYQGGGSNNTWTPFAALSKPRLLSKLSITDADRFSQKLVLKVSEQLATMPSLVDLTLIGNCIWAEGSRALAKGLSQTMLRRLVLRPCDGAMDLDALMAGLPVSLQKLALMWQEKTHMQWGMQEFVEILAKHLPRLQQLRQLDLSWNGMRYGTAKVVFEACRRLPHLEELILDRAIIASADLQELAELPSLRVLSLRGALYEEDKAAMARKLSEVLPALSHLEKLNLQECYMTDADLRAVARSLEHLPNLTHVEMSVQPGRPSNATEAQIIQAQSGPFAWWSRMKEFNIWYSDEQRQWQPLQLAPVRPLQAV